MSEQVSEQEKKAIHKMKRLLSYSKEHEYFSPFQEQEIDYMDIVLKLVEKQQKEIEELKVNLEKFEVSFALSTNDRNSKAEMLKNSVSKDKIREIIENIEEDIDYLTHGLIEDLEKLLEEK